MHTTHRPLIGATTVLVLALSMSGPRAQQRAPGVLSEGVTAVMVDVVVRDRQGEPVPNLTAADFEILENGVPQKIGSFTRISDGDVSAPTAPTAPAAAPGAGGAAAPPVNVGPGVTALVFHELSPEGRQLALDAARSYLGEKEEMAHYVGIFSIDLTLRPLVPFTRNGFAVRRALDVVAAGGTPAFDTPEFQERRSNAADAAENATPPSAGQRGAAPVDAGAPVRAGSGVAYLDVMQARMIESFTEMERDQQGYAATDALMAIASTMGRLPGRKSVVLFSEGLSIPPAVDRLFQGVIAAANRANVSIYAIDAAGLRTDSGQSALRDRVNAAARIGIETGHADGAGGAFTKVLEGNEGALRSADPAAGLGTLARATGGTLFQNTNNLRTAFERIESDLRNYYLLGYTPTDARFDGKFRTIEVRVKRPNLTVAARKGYFAVRNPAAVPLDETEAAAFAVLDRTPVPNAFPVRASTLQFPERGRPGLVPVVVEFATAPLTFQPAKDGKEYTSDFTVIVRFLDAQDEIVRKLSQRYQIRGPLDRIDSAKSGGVVFYRESELPPGTYTMETVVHDGPSDRASVRFSMVDVPRYEDRALRLSSIVLVKRADQVTAQERRADNPLLVGDALLHPNLGDPVSRAAKEIPFYFTIYPSAGAPEPSVELQLLLNGQSLAKLPMPVGRPDESGRIQQLGRLPIAALAPGTYEIRVVARQGDQQAAKSTVMRVVE